MARGSRDWPRPVMASRRTLVAVGVSGRGAGQVDERGHGARVSMQRNGPDGRAGDAALHVHIHRLVDAHEPSATPHCRHP